MDEGRKNLLSFFADHQGALIAIANFGKAEFVALSAGMIDSWCKFHDEDPMKLSKVIAHMIEGKYKEVVK